MFKVLIIDDHPLFRDSLAGILNTLKVQNKKPNILQADSAAEALRIVHEHDDFNLILTDIDMPGMDGITFLQQVKILLPNTTFVMISGSEKNTDVQKALHHGAKGFIQKSSETSVLLAALQLILAGGTYIPPLMLEVSQELDVLELKAPTTLTPRQMDILKYLHKGQQNKVIAFELDLSEATVKVHVRHIFSVLGVKNRTQAVQKALELGIL